MVCPGYYQTKSTHASPSRTLRIDPAKDYSSPLKVETSVEYDLPAHIYPPKGSEPILMIHPGFVSAVPRARSRAVITPTPTATVATSGAIRPLAPLQQGPLNNSVSRAASRSAMHMCTCGNPNCNSSSVKSASVNNVRNVQKLRNVQSVSNITTEQSVSSRDIVVAHENRRTSEVILQKPQQVRSNTVIFAPPHFDRESSVLPQQPSMVTGGTLTTASTPNTSQPFPWGAGGRCRGSCCNPRSATIAPPQAEFVAPGLPLSLLAARTPPRGPAGGSPKLKGARSRRGLSVASSVNLPDYMTMSSSRSSRITGGTTSAHNRVPRVPATSMGGALVATPAPPMAHQNITTSQTISLDLASLAHSLTAKTLFPSQQHHFQPELHPSSLSLTASIGPLLATSMAPSSMSSNTNMGTNASSTSSLLAKVVDLSRDSGCSTGGGYPLDGSSERRRELVDSGFSTPIDIPVSDDFLAETFSLPSWKESPTSYAPVIGSVPTSSSSFLSGTQSSHHQYLPQPLWNLVY